MHANYGLPKLNHHNVYHILYINTTDFLMCAAEETYKEIGTAPTTPIELLGFVHLVSFQTPWPNIQPIKTLFIKSRDQEQNWLLPRTHCWFLGTENSNNIVSWL